MVVVQHLLADGFVLDNDLDRIDRAAVYAFVSRSYWVPGRDRAVMDHLIATAARVIGLYKPESRQMGFARAVSDFHTVSCLADVYVLDEVRGRGFGLELGRFTVDGGSLGHTKWLLRTRGIYRLYAKLGFVSQGERTWCVAGNRVLKRGRFVWRWCALHYAPGRRRAPPFGAPWTRSRLRLAPTATRPWGSSTARQAGRGHARARERSRSSPARASRARES